MIKWLWVPISAVFGFFFKEMWGRIKDVESKHDETRIMVIKDYQTKDEHRHDLAQLNECIINSFRDLHTQQVGMSNSINEMRKELLSENRRLFDKLETKQDK